MRKRQFGKGRLVIAEDTNLAQDYMELNIKEAVSDCYENGTIRRSGSIIPHPSLEHTVTIDTTVARTSTGERILISTPDNIYVKPSVDPGVGKEVYITAYVEYKYSESEQDVDDDEVIYYKDYQNSYEISTIQGIIANIGSAVKPTIPYDSILLCDILYDTTLYASGLIQQSDIDTSRQVNVDLMALINSIGQPDGIATLGSDGKVPTDQLPDTIIGGVQYKGTWDCSGGIYPTPTSTGDYYICTNSGTISGTEYDVGDWLVFNGATWDKIDNTGYIHASQHIQNGSDEIDGDKLDIDWDPIYYTPTSTGISDNIDHLSSHLNGIDTLLGECVTSTGNLTSTQKEDLTDGGDTILHIHDSRYYTESELNNGQLDTRYYTESESDSKYSSTGHVHTTEDSNTIRLVTSADSATTNDNVILCQGEFTLSLPAVSECIGLELSIKNTSTGTITVDADESEEIDGSTTYVLDSQYESVIIISDGTKWHILAKIVI